MNITPKDQKMHGSYRDYLSGVPICLWNINVVHALGFRVNQLLRGIIKPKGIGTIILELEDGNGNIYNLNIDILYYFPRLPKLFISIHKWSHDIAEDKVFQEVIYLKVVGKISILVCDNRKYQKPSFIPLGIHPNKHQSIKVWII